jgi:DNA adenine methylase
MLSSYSVLVPATPSDPPAPWLGGKKLLARRICRILAATPHDAYAEPFLSMGGVFLRRALKPRVEVINDVAGDVVTLFRVLQRHPEALLRELRWRPAMRVEFDRLKGARVQDLTDIERAARLLYLQRLAYAGKVSGRSFGVDPTQPQVFDLKRLEPRLWRIHERLGGVVIEHLDWSDFIPRYDRPGTLFYLDPPYWGCEDDYGTGLFGRADFARLAEMLKAIAGKFILSINDVPEVRTAFAWADIEPVETRYSVAKVAGETRPPVGELLIGKGVNLAAAGEQGRLI